MNPMQLYKLLQQNVGELNQIVVDLYNCKIEADDAKKKALEILQKTTKAISE
jgi:hypothetical protein